MIKRKWKPLEILLAALILLAVLGAVFFFWWATQAEQEGVPLEYALIFESVEGEKATLSAAIPVGCAVYSSNGTAHLGTVTHVTVFPHRIPTVGEDKIVFADAPGCYDIRLTVRAEGQFSPNEGFRVSSLRIVGGSRGDFYAGGYFGAGVILRADEVEK